MHGLALPQDIVTAHEHFNIEEFVQQFQESLKVTAPRKRAFLLSWMQARPPRRAFRNLVSHQI